MRGLRQVCIIVLALSLPGCRPAVSDPNRYVGHYQTGCFAHQWVRMDTLDGRPIMVRAEFTVATAGPDALALTLRQHYYRAGDLACAGPELGTEISAIRMAIDPRTTEVAYGSERLPAARIRVYYAPPSGPGQPNPDPQQLNGLAYPAEYFTAHRFKRYLLLMIGEGIYFGNEERALDSEGFPIYLEDEAAAYRVALGS